MDNEQLLHLYGGPRAALSLELSDVQLVRTASMKLCLLQGPSLAFSRDRPWSEVGGTDVVAEGAA